MECERVGIDTGGTFTDFVILEQEGNLNVFKRPSTPSDPSESILLGLRERQEQGALPRGFDIVHGTTVATNALLERKGARTALLTTAGFRDVLEIGRQARERLYALHPTRPLPLLPRELRHEIVERVDYAGHIVTELDANAVEAQLQALIRDGVESLAVCFLFSYLNPAHEQLVGKRARVHGLRVSLSHEVAPEPREYERASTTVANARIAPIMTRYLEQLQRRLQEVDAGSLRVMQSDGGALTARNAGELAVRTVLSGPAAGVIAAKRCGLEAGISHLLTFDMGGTSTDVALIAEHECPVVTSATLAGIPIRTPMLDIHTVGAGGGSLAWRDSAGGLRVGPQSAGADPGPVAYGKGDTLTVTDANLLLGRLPAAIQLGDCLSLDKERVQARFETFAQQLGCASEVAAEGIVRVAEAAMARALRHISVERGHDPADFALLSFGGAGGLHACALADSLGIRRILIPRYPGAFSALGLAFADIRREFIFPVPFGAQDTSPESLPKTSERLRESLSALRIEAEHAARAESLAGDRWQLQSFLDLRYAGQSFELRVPVAGEMDLQETLRRFHRANHVRYGYADVNEPVEILAVRLVAVGHLETPELQWTLPKEVGEPIGAHRVFYRDGWRVAPVFRREYLAFQQRLTGPAIVVQPDATTWIAPGWSGSSDQRGNILLTK